ncbi:MAG: hypothetical protein CMN79_04585 [Spirochaetales bacterium]|nr:hypothetical protein [Spirochaetales bacterium]
MYNYEVETFIKRLVIGGAVFVFICGLISLYLNDIESKRKKNNIVVNSFIEEEVYKDKEKTISLLTGSDKVKKYNSSYLLPVLSANYLFQLEELDGSLIMLENVSEPESDLLNDLIFSLKSKVYAKKGMCNQSLQSFRKISFYNSITTNTKSYLRRCLKEEGV